MTGPGRHFEGKPFLNQHGRSIGWVRASTVALRPGQKGSERQLGVVWPWLFPQQNRLDVTSRSGSANHLLKPGQVIRIIQDLLGHKALSTSRFYTHWLNPAPLRGTTRPTFFKRPTSWFSDP